MVPILAIVIVHSDFLEHVGPVLQSVPELPISEVFPAVKLCGESHLSDRELVESILSHEGAHGDIRSLLKRWRMMPNLGHDPQNIVKAEVFPFPTHISDRFEMMLQWQMFSKFLSALFCHVSNHPFF